MDELKSPRGGVIGGVIIMTVDEFNKHKRSEKAKVVNSVSILLRKKVNFK